MVGSGPMRTELVLPRCSGMPDAEEPNPSGLRSEAEVVLRELRRLGASE